MPKIVVVAFLQNLWARDPERVAGLIEKHGRCLVIQQLLFAGGVTGRRLKSTFGELCDNITWEEASPEIAGDASTICAPDLIHIQAVLDYHRPGVVVAFGKVAGDAISCVWAGELIRAPHPAARQVDTRLKLRRAAEKLRLILQAQ